MEAIPPLVRKIQKVFLEVSRGRGRIGTIGLNVGIFVPKPGTPLELYEAMSAQQVRRHLALLQKQLSRICNLRYQPPSQSLAQVQTVLSRGDVRSGDFVLAALQAGGQWKSALREWSRIEA
jgi:hypothetical protein